MLSVLRTAVAMLRQRGRELVLADLFFKAVSFVVLVPLAGGLLHLVLWLAGPGVLADADIVRVCLRPLGAVGAVLLAAVWVGILALELVTLLFTLALPAVGGIPAAVWQAWVRRRQVFVVTAQLVVRGLVTTLPFVAVAWGVYRLLLGDADINFYLSERPPEFQLACAIGGLLVLGLTVVLLRLFSGWLLALPLVVFADVPPAGALAESRRHLVGKQGLAFGLLAGWAAAVLLVSGLATAAVVAGVSWLVPLAASSVPATIFVVGGSLLVWLGVNLLINLLATVTFAVLLAAAFERVLDRPLAAGLGLPEAARAEAGWRGLLTPRRLFVGAVVGCLLAGIAGVVAARRVRLDDDVVIMGHRGAAGLAPENTLAAVERAIAERADWVEVDVQESADGEVVVIHDSDFMKLAGVGLKVWEASQADLDTIDVGSRYDSRCASERVPTLRQLLEVCRGRIGVNIELKSYGHGQRLEQRVVDIVEASGSVESVMLMSLERDIVRRLKTLRPDWQVGLLLSVLVGDVKGLEADFLAVNARFVSHRFVRQAHRAGKQVYAWTVNDPVAMSRMIGRDVDGLITDRPDLARDVIEQRATFSPMERLLLELAEMLGAATLVAEQ